VTDGGVKTQVRLFVLPYPGPLESVLQPSLGLSWVVRGLSVILYFHMF
jgi:hypothetical protein